MLHLQATWTGSPYTPVTKSASDDSEHTTCVRAFILRLLLSSKILFQSIPPTSEDLLALQVLREWKERVAGPECEPGSPL